MGLFSLFKASMDQPDAPEVADIPNNADALYILMLGVCSLDKPCAAQDMSVVSALNVLNNRISGTKTDLDYCLGFIEEHGAAHSAISAFISLDPSLHEAAFMYACIVAFANGYLTPEEEATLVELTEFSLILSEEKAQQIIAGAQIAATKFVG